MTSLVTGGTGLIGSNIVRKLVYQGEKVVAFDISPNMKFLDDITEKITFIQGDITNLNEIIDAIKVNKIEYIYHTAFLLTSVIGVMPARAINVNGVGMVNVLEASRIMDIKKIVYTSSIRVFDGLKGDIYDDSPTHNVTLYGSLKRLGEIYGLHYHDVYGLDFRGVRLPAIFGPGDTYATHTHSKIIENAAIGKSYELTSQPNQMTTALYVKDAANAHIFVLNAEEKIVKQRIYFVGGENCTYQEYVDTVKKYIPEYNIKFISERQQQKVFLKEDKIYHDKYITEELGWKPSYSLEEGIKETIDEIRKKPQLYSKGYYVKDRYV